MRYALVIGVLLAMAAPALAADTKPEERVFVEWQTSWTDVFVGQNVALILKVGIDEPYFAEHGVQLFREKLEVPVQVTARWPGDAVEGARYRTPERPDQRRSVVVNGEQVIAGRGSPLVEQEGRSYRLLSVIRDVRFEEPGDVVVPGPAVRFAFANRFEEDFDGARVAVDPEFFTVRGAPLNLRVRALPDAGRPASFGGAIALFAELDAGIAPRELEMGEAATLTLRIRGVGRVAAPKLPDLPGWHLRGVRDDGAEGWPIVTRTFIYELAPRRAGTLTIPAIEWSYFEPGKDPGYRVLKSDPLEVVVRGDAPAAAPAPAPESSDPKPEDEDPLWPYAVLGAIAGALAVLALGRARTREREQPPEAAGDAQRIEAARAALAAHADERTLIAFLAAHLDGSASSVVGPGLAERLVARGVPADVAERVADMLEALVAARYGGAPAEINAALVEDLQSALTT